MPDFYFRGTLTQYWKAIYAEYLRFNTVLGREPFTIIATELKLPLYKYEPTIFDAVIIEFRDEEQRNCIVSVKADTVLGAQLVNLHVNIFVTPLKKSDGSAYAGWMEIQTIWLEKGWLINPAVNMAEMAQIGMGPEQLLKPKSGAGLTPYFDRFHQRKKEGRRYTLKQVAEETGFEYGYIRQLHSRYLQEQALAASNKRTNKN